MELKFCFFGCIVLDVCFVDWCCVMDGVVDFVYVEVVC